MTDISLKPIRSGYNLQKINDNFEEIEANINNTSIQSEGGNNTMQQELDMNSNSIINYNTDLEDPSSLISVGEADARYVNSSGDSMEGPLSMEGNRIINLGGPKSGQDAVNLNYISGLVIPTVDDPQVTTLQLILSSVVYPTELVINSIGYGTSGQGGGAWKQNGVTGQTPSQTPAQLGDALLNDANGNQWRLISNIGGVVPEELGAIGDLSGDDQPYLQAATNTLNPVWADGKYAIGSTLQVKSSIHSSGGVIKRRDGAGMTNLLKLNNVSGIKVRGLSINGNKDNAGGGFTSVQVEDCFDVRIEYCHVLNAVGHNISFTNSDSCRAVNNLVEDAGSVGVEVRSSTNTHITNNKVKGGIKGIDFSRAVNNNTIATVANNMVSACSGNGISIPRDVATSIPYTTDVTVTGNIVSFAGLNGFLVQCNRGTVTGNIAKNNGSLISHQGFVINGTDLTCVGEC